jgi:hemoglobin
VVLGCTDDRPLSWHADGQALALNVDATHFDRWLSLFEKTAREVCPPAAEAHFVERARRIAASLELGIAGAQGVLLANGERFRQKPALG